MEKASAFRAGRRAAFGSARRLGASFACRFACSSGLLSLS
eukprot:CAMPEP_0195135752 /NCGR_PEP_ID=MMETSP0448-20130528/153003_1 /TAXON_ID=66468 /ORGANISM="Heterocapsa triquestra, Strain CCMP 448" /LENGTH=39 /DNA_ID= /DNA_START= /DNA_END= /DNA_ORIENTATION=